MALSLSPSESGLKKMRKGTRSCKECRRRKVRCIYPDEQSQICEECLLHRRNCAVQGLTSDLSKSPFSGTQSVRVRIAKLESMIERISKNPRDNTTGQVDGSRDADMQLAQGPNRKYTMNDLAELDLQSQARTPLLTLFNNEILTNSDKNTTIPPNTFNTISFSSTNLSDQDKLMSTISADPNIYEINASGGGWWLAWQDFYPGLKDMEIARSLNDYVSYYISRREPVMTAVALLCVAMSLQHIRPGIDDEHLDLSTSPHDLQTRILAAVDEVVLTNNNFLARKDGLIALIMRAKVHAESNQLRKSWLRIRQAILTGLEMDFATPRPEISSNEITDRQRFMGGLFETDRILSLTLGLPYAVDDNFTSRLASIVLLSPADLQTRMRALRRVTAIAAGHVNDRNADMQELPVERTREIQLRLDSAAASMPLTWWDISSHSQATDNAQNSHEHLMTQLWFYQVRALLHLPFMLRASSELQFEENRTACLEANRKLLRIFQVMSENASLAAYTCKCEDFQALFAGIMLLIGMLQYSSRGMEPIGSSFEEDIALIEATENFFRFTSKQQGGSMAKQGLKVLTSLHTFLVDDQKTSDLEETVPSEVFFFLPYFGTISVQSSARPMHRQPQADMVTQLLTPPFDNAHARDQPSGDTQPEIEPYRSSGFEPPNNELGFPDFDQTLYQFGALPTDLNQQNMTFNLDDIMLGTELEQNWNGMIDCSNSINYMDTSYLTPNV